MNGLFSRETRRRIHLDAEYKTLPEHFARFKRSLSGMGSCLCSTFSSTVFSSIRRGLTIREAEAIRFTKSGSVPQQPPIESPPCTFGGQTRQSSRCGHVDLAVFHALGTARIGHHTGREFGFRHTTGDLKDLVRTAAVGAHNVDTPFGHFQRQVQWVGPIRNAALIGNRNLCDDGQVGNRACTRDLQVAARWDVRRFRSSGHRNRRRPRYALVPRKLR